MLGSSLELSRGLIFSQAGVWLSQQNQKEGLAGFPSSGIKKLRGKQSRFCKQVFRFRFFGMPQGELVFLGKVHGRFVDRGGHDKSQSPLFSGESSFAEDNLSQTIS